MKPINLVEVIKEYTSGWIALAHDYSKVIAHAPDYIKLEGKLKKMGITNAILLPAAKNYRGIIT